MSRFLFVVQPLTGHVNPAAAIVAELAGRGHEVAWAGSEKFLRPVTGPSATIYPTGTRLYRDQEEHGFAALKSLWDGFIVPLARFTLPAVDKAVRACLPDVVVADQHAVAGALAARRHGLAWATMAPSAIELTRPYSALPKVEEWIASRLAGLRALAGLDADVTFSPLCSPYLVLAFTCAALTGDAPLPPRTVLTGPVLGHRLAAPPFDTRLLDPARRLVLVTAGTVAGGLAAGFYAAAMEALAPLADQVQGVVAAGSAAAGEPPPNVLLRAEVPVLDLMPHAAVVVCHAGMNTVNEALAHGVPMVMAPIRHDQPVAAAQVAAAGAGIRVPFHRASPALVHAAVTEVLGNPAYRAAAARIRESFNAAGGAVTAAERLERLARQEGNISK